jgi:diguanylate cyclase (GGDEF)-like protein
MFRILRKLTGNIYLQLAVCFAIATAIVPLFCDIFWQPLATRDTDLLASQIAKSYENETFSRQSAIDYISGYRLSWIYVTARNQVVGDGVAPEVTHFRDNSGNVEYGGKTYYEAVAPLRNNRLLHVGVRLSPIWVSTISGSGSPALRSLPLQFVLLMEIGIFFSLCLFLNRNVLAPLRRLKQAALNRLSSTDAELKQAFYRTGGPNEFVELAEAMSNCLPVDELPAGQPTTVQPKEQQKSEADQLKVVAPDSQYVSQRNIAELFTKEADEEFLTALARELDSMTSISQACQRTLERLNDKFPTTLTAGAFFISEKHSNYKLDSTVGLSSQAMEVLDDLDHQPIFREIFSTGRHVSVDRERFGNFGLKQLATTALLSKAVYLPISFQNRNIGALAFFATEPTQGLDERLRILRNVAELCSRVLYRLLLYREELQSARTDALTGLYNKKFFYEIAPQLLLRASVSEHEHPLSIVMVDGDNFKSINDTYGHQIGDQVITELAETVRKCTRMREYGIKPGRPKDYVIRYGGEEILVILENTSAESAVHVADRIRKTIESKLDWAGGISKLTVSLGVSSYPSDAKSIDELILKADAALYYVKEHLNKNAVCQSANVPKGFRATKYATIGGNLGIFDPAALLQSIATAQKSGVLTVESEDGRKIWMLYEQGRPLQAKLGQFAGPKAIIEFVTTFEDGKFNFQEIHTGTQTKAGGKNPASRADACNVQQGLEGCLLDAALAQDNLNWAKKVMPHPNVFPQPVSDDALAKIMPRLRASGALSDDEFKTMEAMLKLCDDASTFADMFQRLNHIPTAVLWRAAALLIDQNIVEISTPDEYASTTLKLKPLATERLQELQKAETEQQLAEELKKKQKSFSAEFSAMLEQTGAKPALPKGFLLTDSAAFDDGAGSAKKAQDSPTQEVERKKPDQFAVNRLKALISDSIPKGGPIEKTAGEETNDGPLTQRTSPQPEQPASPRQGAKEDNTHHRLVAKIEALKSGSAQKAKELNSSQKPTESEQSPQKTLAEAVGESLDRLLPEPKKTESPPEKQELESQEAREKRILEMQLLQMQLAKHNSMTEAAMLKKLEPSEKKHPELIDKLEEALDDKLTERKEGKT